MDPKLLALLSFFRQRGGLPSEGAVPPSSGPPSPLPGAAPPFSPQPQSLSEAFSQAQSRKEKHELDKVTAPARIDAQTALETARMNALSAPNEMPEDPALRFRMEDLQHQRSTDADMRKFTMKLAQDRELGTMDLAQKGLLERLRIERQPVSPPRTANAAR